ncbi:hypothetical protein BGW38_000300 [Lunasporangiospora selenospora]|uniref:Uncharacterized protein n=1 Tax=Lunasporangiospora selenospora TaxID=979761 RepID=A0A9P6G2H1_9FUNG|nr:hypothetical protein BGW38_000300 [Lunasporangiospora selenospora]
MSFTTTTWGPVTTRSPPYPTIPPGHIGVSFCSKWIGSESNCIETMYIDNFPPAPTAGGSDKGEKDLEKDAFVSSTPTATTSATPTNSGTPISKSSSTNTNTSKATSTTGTTTGKPNPTQKSGAIQLSKSGFTILVMLFAATILAN